MNGAEYEQYFRNEQCSRSEQYPKCAVFSDAQFCLLDFKQKNRNVGGLGFRRKRGPQSGALMPCRKNKMNAILLYSSAQGWFK
jgi:hypothetical protein